LSDLLATYLQRVTAWFSFFLSNPQVQQKIYFKGLQRVTVVLDYYFGCFIALSVSFMELYLSTTGFWAKNWVLASVDTYYKGSFQQHTPTRR
jgi:hypothetical protein